MNPAYQQLVREIASRFTPGDLIGPGDIQDLTPRQLQVVANHDPCLLGVAIDNGGDTSIIDDLDDKDRCYAMLLNVLGHQAKASIAPDVQDELDRLNDDIGLIPAPDHGMRQEDFA